MGESTVIIPIPHNEKKRLELLYETKLLYSDNNDPDYDRYTSLTSRVLNVPVCSVSLITEDKVWYKSKVGFSADYDKRSMCFASYTIIPENSDVFYIEDTFKNETYKNLALSRGGPPFVRFYAGAALLVEGVKIGSLCICDFKPRPDFKLEHRMNFMDFGAAISTLISERRRSVINFDMLNALKLTLKMENNPLIKMNSIDTALGSLKSIDKVLEQTGIKSNQVREVASNFSSSDSNVETSPTILVRNTSCQMLFKEFLDPTDVFENDETRSLFDEIVNVGNGVRCNIFEILDQTKFNIQEMSEKCQINWMVDRSSLDLGQHISHPDVVNYLLTSTISYFASKWSQIYVFIGFKKNLSNRNHKRSLHSNHSLPGIIDGRLNVRISIKLPATQYKKYLKRVKKFHTASSKDPQITTEILNNKSDEDDEANLNSEDLRSRRLLKSKFEVLDDILRDIGGSSRVSDLFAVVEDHLSTNYSEKQKIALNVPDDDIVDDVSSGSGSISYDVSSNASTVSLNRAVNEPIIAERSYDYSIPCIIAIPTSEMLKEAEKSHKKISELSVNSLSISGSNSEDSISYAIKYPSYLNTNEKKETKVVIIITSATTIKSDSNNHEDYNYNLEKLLKSQGYQVTVTNNPEVAIELLKWTKFDVAFIDITMKTIGDMSVLQVYSSWLQEPTQCNSIHVNHNTLIVGISGPVGYLASQMRNSKDINQPRGLTRSPSTGNVFSRKHFSSSTSEKKFKKPSLSMKPISISTTPPLYSALKFNLNKIDNILPNVNTELLQLNAFNYGMHFYFPNPSDDIHLLVYLMSVRRRYKKIEDVVSALEKKTIENSPLNSNFSSEIGSPFIVSDDSTVSGDNEY